MYTTWSSSVSYKIFYLLILCIKKKDYKESEIILTSFTWM